MRAYNVKHQREMLTLGMQVLSKQWWIWDFEKGSFSMYSIAILGDV